MKQFAILFLLVSSLLAEARISFVEVKDLDTWETMLQLAKKQDQHVLVYVSSMVCPECKKMRKSTFRDKALSNYVNDKFLPIQVDAYSPVAQALNGMFDLEDLPSFLLLNTNEFVFYQKSGFIGPQEMLLELQQAYRLIEAYPDWQKGAVDGTLSKEEWIDFLLIEYQNNRVSIENPIITSVSSLLDSADFSKKSVLQFIQQLGIDVDGPIFKTLVVKPNWITDTTSFDWANYQRSVFNYNVYTAIEQKDSILLEDILFQIQKLKTSKGIKNLAFKGRQLYLAELGRWDDYTTYTRTYLDSLPVDSVNEYEVEAMHLMEHYSGEQSNNAALNFLKQGIKRRETFELYFALSLYFYNDFDYLNAYKAAYRAKELSINAEQEDLARNMMRQIELDY